MEIINLFQHWEEPSVSLTTDLWWSNLGIIFSNPDVSFITHLQFIMDMKEQMGRWFSISNTYSKFSLSCLTIGYNFQVIRSIVHFTSFPLLFLSLSSTHQKQNLLSKTLCWNPNKSICTLKLTTNSHIQTFSRSLFHCKIIKKKSEKKLI